MQRLTLFVQRVIVSILLSFTSLAISAQSFSDTTIYMNPDLPVENRVKDLISRMTLEEKVSQMIDVADEIPRLNIPEYNWWNEGLHGVARAGIATVFPQAIGLAATWDTSLIFQIADVISTEARAKHHEALRNNDFGRYKGLTYWSPNINIFRDPRWGRGQETYGEDPYLTSRIGVSFVKGLQGNDPKYFKVIATPKHYAVHSGPESDRHHFDAVTDKRDLYDTYLPAFESTVKEGGAFSVMCAYNRFLGDACCGSPTLLHSILREDWGFKGFIVSDCGAIYDIFQNHKIVETAPEASALAVKAGTDLSCGDEYSTSLVEAVQKGLITEAEIDTSLSRLFTARFRLGMFDPPEMVKYAQIPFSQNNTEEHRKLSLKAAQESIVLLKNDNNVLPLKKDIKKIAVIGPTADSYDMLVGNYNGTPSEYVTPLDGIKNKLGSNAEVIYEQGCNLVEEGAIIDYLTSEFLSTDNKPGLKIEFFKTDDMNAEPFFTRVDPINTQNWLWQNIRIPGMTRDMIFTARWSGLITPPEQGRYNFYIKSSGGYRLYIDDEIVIDNWSNREFVTTSSVVSFDDDKPHKFRLEYLKGVIWPQLQVEWELLDVDYFQQAIDAAKSSDAVIFIGGITAEVEGEEMPVSYDGFAGGDRTKIDLPKVQEDLLKLLYETGKPVILVLTSGSALAVNWENDNLPAIVQIWYPGQEGGNALADVLFGDYNPAGRLPVTFYKSVDQLPPFDDYYVKGKTYRYFKEEPLYPFGYGLSYTKFEYSNLTFPGNINAGEELKVSVEVKNSGAVAGDEVVQLYIKDKEASVIVPEIALEGFRRIHLLPGESKIVEFTLQPRQLAVIKAESYEDVKRIVEPGMFEISVGGGQPNKKAITVVLTKELNVTGEPFIISE